MLDTVNKAKKLLEEIDHANDLLNQSLLRKDEAKELALKINSFLEVHIPLSGNDILERKYELEQSHTFWTIDTPSKFVKQGTNVEYGRWVDLLKKLAKNSGNIDLTQSRLFEKGQTYSFARHLSKLFKSAKTSIIIVDTYPKGEILEYLEDVVSENRKIKISIIATDNKDGKKLNSLVNKFNQEFNVSLNVFLIKIGNEPKFRGVVLDENTVFVVSSSIDRGGEKDTVFQKAEEALATKILTKLKEYLS